MKVSLMAFGLLEKLEESVSRGQTHVAPVATAKTI